LKPRLARKADEVPIKDRPSIAGREVVRNQHAVGMDEGRSEQENGRDVPVALIAPFCQRRDVSFSMCDAYSLRYDFMILP
jgi:hypothetical protein